MQDVEAKLDVGHGWCVQASVCEVDCGAALTTHFLHEARFAGGRRMDETDDVSPDDGTSSSFLGNRDNRDIPSAPDICLIFNLIYCFLCLGSAIISKNQLIEHFDCTFKIAMQSLYILPFGLNLPN
jgi:hypothetical protein